MGAHQSAEAVIRHRRQRLPYKPSCHAIGNACANFLIGRRRATRKERLSHAPSATSRRSKTVQYVILPGITGSGVEHWQTKWEESDRAMRRFAPGDWDQPVLEDWVESLEKAVAEAQEPVVLVAHSLACLLVAHWAAITQYKVAGAFLVSVPDPNAAAFPAAARSFRSFPTAPLPFPSLIVSATDDPFGSVEYRLQLAEAWGSKVVLVGEVGHINSKSGLGPWQEGRDLLTAFSAGLRDY